MAHTGAGRHGCRSAVVLVVVVAALLSVRSAWASSWTTRLSSSSAALSQSLTIETPTNVTSGCPAPLTLKVVKLSWSAMAHATFGVYQSTTSATTGFSLVASGITTTSWTSGTLGNGSYWYAITATFGSSAWSSAESAATGPRTIKNQSPVCS